MRRQIVVNLGAESQAMMGPRIERHSGIHDVIRALPGITNLPGSRAKARVARHGAVFSSATR